MKKLKFNLFISIISILMLTSIIALLSTSCDPGPSAPVCDTSNSDFMTLYNADTNTDAYTLDIQTMEYTFERSVAGNICAIGYEGHPNLVGSTVYKMEILDYTTSTVLFSGTYSFTAGSKSYQNLPTSLAIVSGQKYTVRRTVTSYGSSIGNTISHLKWLPAPFTPIVHGNMTIVATKTYEQYSASAPYNITNNGVLPCIDIIFE